MRGSGVRITIAVVTAAATGIGTPVVAAAIVAGGIIAVRIIAGITTVTTVTTVTIVTAAAVIAVNGASGQEAGEEEQKNIMELHPTSLRAFTWSIYGVKTP